MRNSNLLKQAFGISGLRQALNVFGPSLYYIHQRNFVDKPSKALPNIHYSPLRTNITEQDFNEMFLNLPRLVKGNRSSVLDLRKPEVLQVATQDVELSDDDKFGSIIIASKGEVRIKYGDYGVMPSSTKTPEDLLKKILKIPANTFGVLNIGKHIPFLIKPKRFDAVFALSIAELSKVYDHEENKSRYSLNIICKLDYDDIKRLTLELQTRIYKDPEKENFYEETTSKVYKPTIYNKSSGTLMSFENEDITKDKTTAMHYHPGERSLIIITTNKQAAITLNFCGVAEDPDTRKDCEAHLKFPENSIMVLNFPDHTHHKFHGEFVCMSVHPKEGPNLIQAVQSGKLLKGFLETATVFSKTYDNQEEWKLSMPNDNKVTQGKSAKFSFSR